MSVDRIFYINSGALTVYGFKGRAPQSLASFPSSSEGQEELSRYLADGRDQVSLVLMDVIEEEYRNINLPHVTGAEKRQLFQRRAEQLFRRTPYYHGEVHGRENSNRRDDKVLFTALTNPDHLNSWLSILNNNKVSLKGIYSVPMFGESILRMLAVDSNNVLLLTRHQGGVLRQSFFSDKRLKASRLSPCHMADINNFADYVKSEAEKNQRYLNRLQLLNPSEVLDIYVVGSEGLSELHEQVDGDGLLNFHVLDTTRISRSLGLKNVISPEACEEIFIYMAGRSQPAANYARTVERRYFLHGIIRRSFLTAGAGAAMAGVVMGMSNIFSALEMKSEMSFIEQEMERLEVLQKREIAALPPLTVSARDMKAVVDLRDSMVRGTSGPGRMMVALSKGVKLDSRIHLDEIIWDNSSRDEVQASEGNANNIDGPHRQIAILKGRLSQFSGDLREAFSIVDKFMAVLRSLPGFVAIESVKMPVNINPNEVLNGDAGIKVYSEEPAFELTVVMEASGDEI